MTRWHSVLRQRIAFACLSPALAFVHPPTAAAQENSGATDSVRLPHLQSLAASRDPRLVQLDLLAAQSALRQSSIDADRLPSFSIAATAQYQSDVTSAPFRMPGGAAAFTAPHDTYDSRVELQQRIYDPSLSARRAVERASLAESQARVRSTLYGLRQAVDESFFTVARLQWQRGEVANSITDLEAQLRLANDRVRLGSALPSEALALEAELLRRRQTLAEIDAGRSAAIAVLATLTDTLIPDSASFALPHLDSTYSSTTDSVRSVQRRPEYEQFERARDLLRLQERAISSRDLPRVSAYGRGGYGKPGLNVLNDSFDTYWLAGVQVQWAPWTWGTTERERQVLALQRRIVASEEAAFTDAIRRQVETDLAAVRRLEATIPTDDQIIALRERIARETRLRFSEGVVTSAEYIDRQTDVLTARLARATHLVELAQARRRLLTTLGLD